MKGTTARFTLIALALGLSMSAWAKPKYGNVTLYHDATVNGTNLPAGDYVVKYESEGTTTQVQFLKDGKQIATTEAQLKTLPKKFGSSRIVYAEGANQHSVSEIDFAGKDTAITFGAPSANAGK
jgi:hypothetical protein